MSDDALAEWCSRWLGSAPAQELFDTGFLSTVKGLRLRDGREVVVKVRPNVPRLTGCVTVHRALWSAGFECPEPLTDVEPIDDIAVSAESFVPGDVEPLPEGSASQSAAALARLIELAPAPESVPSLAPSPSWTAWDHTEPALWPPSEELDTDLNDVLEPQWLARVAAALRDLLRQHGGTSVIGHGDWHPDNVRWRGSDLAVVYDWDSVICQPEPAIVGLASVSFRGVEDPATFASVDDSAAFIAAYQLTRGCAWSARDEAACWAAGLWQRVLDAKVQSLRGDAEKCLSRPEAALRLRRAGLDPRLVADDVK